MPSAERCERPTQAVKLLGPIAYIIKARVTIQRDLGYAMSPFNAFLFIEGLVTLALRMREHSRNAQAVVDYLKKHPAVTRVIHPSQQAGKFARRAKAYLRNGLGGLVGFELRGGKEAGRQFIDALKLFYHVANIGDVRSLAIHPATTTHSQLSPEDQLATGVSDNYVRLSVGLEHIDDIIADLEQALRTASGQKAAAEWPSMASIATNSGISATRGACGSAPRPNLCGSSPGGIIRHCAARSVAVARVAFTTNLQRHLACPVQEVPGGTVRAVFDTLFAANPRLRSYILDDQGRLRRHVHIYVNDTRVSDPERLADRVDDRDEIFVFQALTGG